MHAWMDWLGQGMAAVSGWGGEDVVGWDRGAVSMASLMFVSLLNLSCVCVCMGSEVIWSVRLQELHVESSVEVPWLWRWVNFVAVWQHCSRSYHSFCAWVDSGYHCFGGLCGV
ncbi:hypothetical protein KC19_2G055500 [Ceratodon purpureus]|uniref:Uncharacterized protein n=1 Tax=Ceratodon purpureus TaxID=3225 RepID=A0A8T0ITA9_CERPU|nr:hypothetical protein KC19_2G055500 [Ceratodon purpureus]